MVLKNIRVRFAPSPTGYLHIGGARTALLNYLFARHHSGHFFLRIEDTDISRSDSELTETIIKSLQWLGLIWDGNVVYQSQRIYLYRDVCDKLLQSGKAYRCFCSAEELGKKKEQAKKENRDFKYDRFCASISENEVREKLQQNIPFTVRFRIPEGKTVIQDLVHGKIVINNDDIEDFIILRSDGSPVYQVAVVVDDHEMGITHVIRGDDHLSNTPKQILLYQALQWSVPEFAHVPLILGPDKKRLSKRHGATSVEAYQQNGYLPEALLNFIVLLGWAPKTDEEIFSLSDLIQRFSLEGINKKSAVFDEQKLQWMNGVYLRSKSENELYHDVIAVLHAEGINNKHFSTDYIHKFIHLMKDRVRTINEFVSKGIYFFNDPTEYDKKGIKKYWHGKDVVELLQDLKSLFMVVNDWNEESLERIVRGKAEDRNVVAGKVIHPIRLALTGGTASPGLFEMMDLLGQEVTIRRLRKAIDYIHRIL